MCNTLIERATSMLAGGEIFRLIEQEQQREAVKLLETSLRVSVLSSLLGFVGSPIVARFIRCGSRRRAWFSARLGMCKPVVTSCVYLRRADEAN